MVLQKLKQTAEDYLGKKIYDAMNAQPFNNPVLLSFTVDKGL